MKEIKVKPGESLTVLVQGAEGFPVVLDGDVIRDLLSLTIGQFNGSVSLEVNFDNEEEEPS
jgi:hypothetical protein